MATLAKAQRCGPDFDRWWSRRGRWVEAPNLRRSGESGVERITDGQRLLYCKRQQGHLYRSLRYPLGRPTIQRETQALTAFRSLNVRVPAVVYSGTCNRNSRWRGLLVTEELPGYTSLDNWYKSSMPLIDEVGEKMMQTLAETLTCLHRRRWQHGCLYPKHIFVRVDKTDGGADVQVAVLDLEKSRRRWTKGAAARHDLQQLQRHWDFLPVTHWQVFINSYKSLVNLHLWASVLLASQRLVRFSNI